MKSKFGLAVGLLVCASQIFALDAKARVVMTGNLAEATKEKNEDAKYEFFKLNEKPQKDDDGIVIDFNGGNFGGRLGLWYDLNKQSADKGTSVSFRRSNLWIKPMDSLKITAGYVGNDQLYKERIDDWKVGNPFNLNERDWSKHPGYVNPADVDEMGFGLEIRPVSPLIITAAVARRWGTPGTYGKPFWDYDGDESSYDAWGVSGRYYWRDGICFQAAYRDNGKEQWKVARAAVGLERDNIYAFFQPCFGIDYKSADDKYELSGICFDLYGEYKFDNFKFIAHAPVTLRLTDDSENDPSYMEYVVQVLYNTGKHGNMDELSPYIKIGSLNHDGDNKYAFYRFNKDFSDSVNFDIAPGVKFSVGACEIDVAFELLLHSKLYTEANYRNDFEWRIPFTAEIKF
ncbi:MAG: hypothetical protein KBT11_07170 [Treponema sp.]|nr:hypothetical protein [Candidatus Treponema equifaecale]